MGETKLGSLCCYIVFVLAAPPRNFVETLYSGSCGYGRAEGTVKSPSALNDGNSQV